MLERSPYLHAVEAVPESFICALDALGHCCRTGDHIDEQAWHAFRVAGAEARTAAERLSRWVATNVEDIKQKLASAFDAAF